MASYGVTALNFGSNTDPLGLTSSTSLSTTFGTSSVTITFPAATLTLNASGSSYVVTYNTYTITVSFSGSNNSTMSGKVNNTNSIEDHILGTQLGTWTATDPGGGGGGDEPHKK